jgi:predicted aspartyl protease
MSAFKEPVIALNPKDEERRTEAIDALVDTGSELTWMPVELLTESGLEPRRKRIFITADGKRLTRHIGYAVLRVADFETIDEVVFAEKGDMTLLGVRTIEGFAADVDPIGHRLLTQTKLACGCPPASA